MRHDIVLHGYRFGIRPVTLGDAAFIVGLRTDPELGRYINPTSPNVADQEAWIARYLERPHDYYFIVEDLRAGAPVGAVGVYDVNDGRAEWGRWLIARTSPAAVESALLTYRAGLDVLGLEQVYCRTIADNDKVVSFHDSSGADRGRSIPEYAELGGRTFDAVEHTVDRARWASMRPRLEQLARRVAGT